MRLRPIVLSLLALTCLALPFLLIHPHAPALDRARAERGGGERDGGPYPSDWFGMQRAFPFPTIPQDKVVAAMEQGRLDRALASLSVSAAPLTWQQAGPFNIGGRVTALASAPGGGVVYLASANGGVFRSVNSGTNWTPIFDSVGDFSIGAIAVDPSNPLDRSTSAPASRTARWTPTTATGSGARRDGGATWRARSGSPRPGASRASSVDPADPMHVLVAAMGRQFSTGPDRGLYRTLDGGTTWTKVLFVNDSTGVSDVVINPVHPDTMFCATWERVRRHRTGARSAPTAASGAASTAAPPGRGSSAACRRAARRRRPHRARGRAPRGRRTLYAQIGDGRDQRLRRARAVPQHRRRRRRGRGATWAAFTGNAFGGFVWYFGDVVVTRSTPTTSTRCGVSLLQLDRRRRRRWATSPAADARRPARALGRPARPRSRLPVGNDGGLLLRRTTAARGQSRSTCPSRSSTPARWTRRTPARILGGTQDNSTLKTARALAAGSRSWAATASTALVDPSTRTSSSPSGSTAASSTGFRRSTNGGAVVRTCRLGVTSPTASAGARRSCMDPRNHNMLLAGSQYVYKSTDNGDTWAQVERRPDAPTRSRCCIYGTITTLAISPVDPHVYYAGTDDGKVWRSPNAGGSWDDISAGLPRRWVTARDRRSGEPAHAST